MVSVKITVLFVVTTRYILYFVK